VAASVRLLVVCLGNICRSPMAEGLLRARIATSPLAGRVEVDSAGTGDWHIGQPPDRRAIATAARHGVDISRLRARQFTPRDAETFDWLLCADRANLRDVRDRIAPELRERATMLLAWGGVADTDDVPDPYVGDSDEFEHSWSLLERAADGIVARLLDDLSGSSHD
jgi:protein-tyrosine phosphatase